MKKIGVIGGGQLGQMLALAGIPLGFKLVFLDPSINAPASLVGEHICADFADHQALTQLAQTCEVITFEFENVDPAALEFLAQQNVAVLPSPYAVQIARDRVHEKKLFTQLNIPTPKFKNVTSLAELQDAFHEISTPVVLKTRTLGYDGKGQFILKTPHDAEAAWQQLGSVPCIVEQMIDFEHEVSLIAVRAKNGDAKFYPVVRNLHQDGILQISQPDNNHPLQSLAENYTRRVLEHLDYVGVLAFEFFVSGSQLIANEIAPRVHNSGHWSIEGASTSQFANHIRAITDLPLGETKLTNCCAMLNLIGRVPNLARILSVPNSYVHNYHKSFRAGRKVGHITLIADDYMQLQELITTQMHNMT